MTEPKKEVTTHLQFEQQPTLAYKLVATVILLLAGAALYVISLALRFHPDIPTVLRWAGLTPLACGGFFVVAALLFLWIPKFPRRLYVIAERCFFIAISVTLPTLTAAVLWQAIRAK